MQRLRRESSNAASQELILIILYMIYQLATYYTLWTSLLLT